MLMATRGKHRMTKTNEARCAGRQRMDAGELAPWVAEFTRRLRQQGYTSLTVKSYDDAARHLAHWLLKAKVAVADIDETVIDRFARHRCRCPTAQASFKNALNCGAKIVSP